MYNSEIVIPQFPVLHPMSSDYKSFWRTQKKRSIEGYWAGGTFVPPALYYYVNFHTIKLNVDFATNKSYARPWLRDVENKLFRYYTEARGFSGFKNDDEYSSHRILLEDVPLEFLKQRYPNTITSTGERKKYIPARQALFANYEVPLGAPLFENQLKNFMLLGSRESGKALKNSELLHTPTGNVIPIGEAQVGDIILGGDGKPTKIEAVYPQGKVPLYSVTLKDRRQVDTCPEHLWLAYVSGRKMIVSTLEMQMLIKAHRVYIPVNQPLEFSHLNSTEDPKQIGANILNALPHFKWLTSSKYQRQALLDAITPHIDQLSPLAIEFTTKLARSLGKVVFANKNRLVIKDHKRIRVVAIREKSPDYATCIKVTNKDKLFVTTDYIVTHNSYSVSGFIDHNYLTDGATEYTDKQRQNPTPVEILVGAADSKFSKDILAKCRDSLDLLPGKYVSSDRIYPSPFAKQYRGSWEVNKEIVAEYKKRTPGGWKVMGSKSSIKHRTFSANPFAAQGTRPLLLVLEEVGMFKGLKQVYTNTVDNLRNGLNRTGMLMMLGTGGDMGEGTLDASEMFYEPTKYDILPFEDIWENRGQIGYFLPAYEVLNEYKDENGNTREEEARKALLKVRKDKGGDGGSSEALNKEMQYRPIVPSEMFLAKTANIFPTAELRRRLSEIQSHKIYEQLEKKVTLYFDPNSKVYNGVNYEVTPQLQAISKFPYEGDALEGAVVIYELPKTVEGQVPPGAYIIGCDPYKDDGQTGTSLASIYVMKTNKYPSTVGYSEIVASYIGRPYLGKNQVNEILHKLSLMYGNAKIYFENNVGNVKDYFDKVRRLDLLARQPVTIFNKKASYDTNPQVIYGYPLSNDKVKWEALQYLRSFLLEERGDNKRNIDLIPDPGLLQELISYNLSGNFDRVSSIIGCILGLEELNNIERRKLVHKVEASDLEKDIMRIIVNNPYRFDAKLPKTATALF